MPTRLLVKILEVLHAGNQTLWGRHGDIAQRFPSKGNLIKWASQATVYQTTCSLGSSEHWVVVQRLTTHSSILENPQVSWDSPEMCVPRLPPLHQTPSGAGAGVWCHCPQWPCLRYTEAEKGERHWAVLGLVHILKPHFYHAAQWWLSHLYSRAQASGDVHVRHRYFIDKESEA